MSTQPDPKWIRGLTGIAGRMGLPVATTRRLVRAGKVPVVRLSEKRVQARPEALDAYMAEAEARGRID
jgi:predicted site-specific integrase-resolvase